ncbi:site-specific DNA-methyltransferase [Candidatus Woesearchaeota archaeon]|nr:site-specific DNA-methyltransferase [Candidatus Woesearchaeota archaeon]
MDTKGDTILEKVDLVNKFFNEDCIVGCKKYFPDNSVDLIITDPPYGINGDTLHKHYNRKEEFVIDGYVEIPQKEYANFSKEWVKQAERILKPGGSMYIVSGYTNLVDILNALRSTTLKEINHIIWKYNFGVYTKQKYISSHYHILFYTKPGAKHTFNTFCRFGPTEKGEGEKGSANYQDREDVWIINREYKPGQIKNKNELPSKLLTKMIQYSSTEGDLVCDLFLGSFSTAKIAIGLNRKATGFEISKNAFDHQIQDISKIREGFLLETLRQPLVDLPKNEGRPWGSVEIKEVINRFNSLTSQFSKKEAINIMTEEFGRGAWSLRKLLNREQKKTRGTNKPFID